MRRGLDIAHRLASSTDVPKVNVRSFSARTLKQVQQRLLGSAFTRVKACTLALSPIRDTHSEGFAIAALPLRIMSAHRDDCNDSMELVRDPTIRAALAAINRSVVDLIQFATIWLMLTTIMTSFLE